ncbi:MAG: ProQ/FinO family protein, partial [Comamonas sp.]
MTEIVSEPQAPQATPQNNQQDQQAGSRSRRGGQGRQPNQAGQQAARPQNPLLEQLAQWHPALFGEQLVPFKRGIFEDLLTAHPELEKEALKTALQQHTRSGRYLAAMASGQQRHDLNGQPVEATLPEHVH